MSEGAPFVVRVARPEDVHRVVAIKEGLAMRPGAGDMEQGGFILGSSPEIYAALCASGRVRVLEVDGAVVGFATTLPDPVFRASEVWAKRERIAWEDFDAAEIEREPIAYFDQLAIERAHQNVYNGAALALDVIMSLWAEGHEHVFTTTLMEPVANEAALPLMRKIGSRRVGMLEETYPGVGRVVSTIHYMSRCVVEECVERMAEQGSAHERRTIAALSGVG